MVKSYLVHQRVALSKKDSQLHCIVQNWFDETTLWPLLLAFICQQNTTRNEKAAQGQRTTFGLDVA